MRQFRFIVYVPVTDDNPTTRSEVELLLREAVPAGASVVFVETLDDEVVIED